MIGTNPTDGSADRPTSSRCEIDFSPKAGSHRKASRTSCACYPRPSLEGRRSKRDVRQERLPGLVSVNQPGGGGGVLRGDRRGDSGAHSRRRSRGGTPGTWRCILPSGWGSAREVLALRWEDVERSGASAADAHLCGRGLPLRRPEVRGRQAGSPFPDFVTRARDGVTGPRRPSGSWAIGLAPESHRGQRDRGALAPRSRSRLAGVVSLSRTGSRASRSTPFATAQRRYCWPAGCSDAVAIKLIGYADTKTLRRYQEVVDELQRDAASRMDQLLGGRGEKGL